MNLRTLLQASKKFLFFSVADRYKIEFYTDINKINISRGKTTAIAFIIIETILLIISLAVNRRCIFNLPNIYYEVMYVLMIIGMVLYFTAFIRLERDIVGNEKYITRVGISFACFILLWCAVISFLDQMSSRQIIVYIAAVLSVAVCPIYNPISLLCIYFGVHAIFISLLACFEISTEAVFINCVNSTSILGISWFISRMRYKTSVENFLNKKEMQEKKNELERLNMELENTNATLRELSCTDSLTGIFNRSVFDRTIKTEWDRCMRHFTPISLFMIDIDFFKEYNDGYGHQAGDDCIRQVAGVLASNARHSSDTVARYGGEEFAVILPDMAKDKAFRLAEQIRCGVEELAIVHEYSSVSDFVTISIGVCTEIPSDKSSVEELIRNTDRALYKAKQKSRNSVEIA